MTDSQVDRASVLVRAFVQSEEPVGMWNLLIPQGEIDSANGNFFFDEQDAARVLKFFESRRVDVVIDYEHGSVKGFGTADAVAPAAGWIKRLKFAEGEGLLGLVDWTDRAVELLKANEYRYLSPAVFLEPDTRHVVRLDSVALTHKPAINGGLRAAASRDSHEWNKPMTATKQQTNQDQTTDGSEVTPDQKIGRIEGLLRTKGVEMPEGASRDTILDALIRFLEGGGAASEDGEGEDSKESAEVASAVRKELSLKGDAGKEAIIVALSRLKGGSSSQGEVTKLRTELDELKGKEAKRNAEGLVEKYVKANKIDPGNEKMMVNALDWAARDPGRFEEWFEAETPYVAPGRITGSNGGPAPTGSRKEEELIAEAMKEHDGKYGEAIIAVQSRLLNERCERTGLTRERAVAVLEGEYPKIFGAAA